MSVAPTLTREGPGLPSAFQTSRSSAQHNILNPCSAFFTVFTTLREQDGHFVVGYAIILIDAVGSTSAAETIVGNCHASRIAAVMNDAMRNSRRLLDVVISM
jgi:hypothetical protein